MTTWNYVIGSEEDFEGAPDWALFIIHSAEHDSKYAVFSTERQTEQCIYNISWKGGPRDEWFDAARSSLEAHLGRGAKLKIIAQREPVTNAAPAVTNDSKYNRPCKGITIDVYDVLKAFNVTCPALQHLIKKALAVGQRGHKDASEDLKDILASAKRAIELSESNK